MISFEDKASRVFIPSGVLLILVGLLMIGFLYRSSLGLLIIFFLGFLAAELLVIGYSLMHKSLRGAWL
jgi:uncharacterized membrane protein HdeD (DUF308 family)